MVEAQDLVLECRQAIQTARLSHHLEELVLIVLKLEVAEPEQQQK